ncbi:hypothetical protein [Rosenbergiella epipactidis]|uniref:hypothetical protein n=1 Tax=Rosenbergiella epipactidis TaxID=1544694 RepID=UPI001F501760|nr:hypothetical protein [Rosenbergiella epipactidis]
MNKTKKDKDNTKVKNNKRPLSYKKESFSLICEKVIIYHESANKSSVDYYFCKAIIAREKELYHIERQAALSILEFNNTPLTPLIQSVIEQDQRYKYSEKCSAIFSNMNKSISENPYIFIVKAFISSAKKQQHASYFNCFMGISASFNKHPPYFDIQNVKNNSLLDFFEKTHRLLLSNRNQYRTLEKLTQFLTLRLQEETSQSLLFFESYFSLNKNPQFSIKVARKYLDAPNLSVVGDSYLNSLAVNTGRAAIRLSDIEEASFWLDYIDDEENAKEIRQAIAKIESKIGKRKQHPLNPEGTGSIALNNIPTTTLIILCAFIDSCGDDWGLKTLELSGKYIFPSEILTERLFQTLAVSGLIKMSTSSFNALNDSSLNQFNEILWSTKFHVNIIGVADTKLVALPALLEELNSRSNKEEGAWEVRRLITIGYFYKTLEYYLDIIDENWAKAFSLNQSTTHRIDVSTLSARDLAYIARSSIRYTAGKHSMGSTTGTKHTCNTLIGSINRYFDWIDEGSFTYNAFERSKNYPVLASERLLQQIAGFTPEDIYNLPPLPQKTGCT